MDHIIEVKHLKKYFATPKGDLHAVDDVSFSIERGKTLGVVGESGCGKSTLGNLIIGLHNASSGQILFEGRDITDLKGNKRRELLTDMQMIFQDPFSSLNPRMCVSQLIAEPLRAFHVCKSKEELDRRVEELMDLAGLARRLYFSFPHELDGGRRQRIGIARALALDPKFIVCDEPVSALDVSIQAQILNLLKRLQQKNGYTYLFITHDLAVVKHISNEVLVMYLGQMVEQAPTAELFRNPRHPYTRALLSAVPQPNPDVEKNKVLEIYDPSCHHYETDKPLWTEVDPGHFVLANQEELAKL